MYYIIFIVLCITLFCMFGIYRDRFLLFVSISSLFFKSTHEKKAKCVAENITADITCGHDMAQPETLHSQRHLPFVEAILLWHDNE